jgi:hypothetical protein
MGKEPRLWSCPPAAAMESYIRDTTGLLEASLAVDMGLVESPFQHTCLSHLQDCVVNGD